MGGHAACCLPGEDCEREELPETLSFDANNIVQIDPTTYLSDGNQLSYKHKLIKWRAQVKEIQNDKDLIVVHLNGVDRSQLQSNRGSNGKPLPVSDKEYEKFCKMYLDCDSFINAYEVMEKQVNPDDEIEFVGVLTNSKRMLKACDIRIVERNSTYNTWEGLGECIIYNLICIGTMVYVYFAPNRNPYFVSRMMFGGVIVEFALASWLLFELRNIRRVLAKRKFLMHREDTTFYPSDSTDLTSDKK
eukprot:CAMPEP_0117428758 /NCGR_PEP_ID=MMETSP0758-20121206/8393_1 /TAXON_ID=63605 /ORGANISM="Percolomonas cosmopolitus, Strain AE-1 (ATCC 50343)" /LENGTH=245 /DNA_ID=CAMNT_0005215289 /DNA_START=19 /DNA_END=753 /DNA_ORIENTATION=+